MQEDLTVRASPTRLAAVIAAGALVGGCASLASLGLGGPPVFEIVNDTDQAVQRLYFHPADARGAGEDVLGDAVLPPGRWTEAPVDRARGCRYALTAELSGGATVRGRGIDVCATRAWRLTQGERGRRVGGARPSGDVMSAQPMSRGLPVCPGDPRCKRKK